jgi:hypothetical protein
MGYTGHTIVHISSLLNKFTEIQTVCDLGAQNNYAQPNLPAPYISEWYAKLERIKEYMCIDLNGENGAKQWDLSEPLKTTKKFDLVTDVGTGEHVKDFYQLLANIDKLTKVGGYIYRENPKTCNWPGHGLHYMTTDFYKEFAAIAGYELLFLDENAAMGNTTDGWNVTAILRKTKNKFIDREQLPVTYTI